MAKTPITQLKEYFKANKRPTEKQFEDLIDSYAHLDDSAIKNLQTSEYTTYLDFPSGYQVGDYVEFLEVFPEMAYASGLYEISIAYTRGSIASAATHLAAVSHSNPNMWRECGIINKNNYVADPNTNGFTIDVNGSSRRFRIRATKVLGVTNATMSVVIKVRSINKNSAWNTLNNKGNDPSNIGLQPMTHDWSLLVGDTFSPDSAKVGLKVTKDAKLGVGTGSPEAKLHVQEAQPLGNINYISASFDRADAGGGSNKIRLKYHNTADLELNSGYSANGFTYGSYNDLNIINNRLNNNTVSGGINFVTNGGTQMNIAPNGNVSIGGLSNSTQPLTISATQSYDEGGPTNGKNSNALLRLQSSDEGYGEVMDFGMNIGPSYGWIQPQDFNNTTTFYDLALNPKGGNVGIGTSNPISALDVKGGITSQSSENEGGSVLLVNNSKPADKARRWAIYNMGGAYGNGLQFWSYFDNGNYGARLVLGDTGNMALYGKLEAKDVVITQTPTADFVFASDYDLKPIQEVEKFISEKNHLPEIPSAKEMTENGVEIGNFQIKLLQKIEELTLYLISQNKEIEDLKKRVSHA
ncbi:hypothetical protein ODZ84_07040 [Chryseobacterium fluminis]|uniref:hypothetical protein n=1 Tax=Chryseobacterium fluminis TaxID=2983606 RepID=UPI0022569485|nr:hypothetical protein [Chryseobacterium sp. MMS21-Ot14]UZT99320.1 hypothetical protein ODZ84_07040 [Chryseobacterium sp. MMS21-Ot14]